MDFLKKAKAHMKELEGDLNKATDSFTKFGIAKKDSAHSPPSASGDDVSNDTQSVASGATATTSATTATHGSGATPPTTVAPSTAGGAATKMPMTVRKNLRDEWQHKKSDLETRISKVLDAHWTVFVDEANVWSYHNDEKYARETPGKCFYSYFDTAIPDLEKFKKSYGPEGVAELNNLASTHWMTLEPEPTLVERTSCDIKDGKFRLLFKPGELGVNIGEGTAEKHVQQAVNKARAVVQGYTALSFEAEHSIKTQWEGNYEPVKAKAETLLATQAMTFVPNFEANFAAVRAWEEAGNRLLNRTWEQNFGGDTLLYYRSFINELEAKGFAQDEMMQEAFKDQVEKNEIVLKVVDKLNKGCYHEIEMEGGVFYMKTTPSNWQINIETIHENLVKLL